MDCDGRVLRGWAHLLPAAVLQPLTSGSMLSRSLGAWASGGGIVMDRLGGFRLCRRLPDTEERLLPSLSAEAMVGTILEEKQGDQYRPTELAGLGWGVGAA